MKMEYDLIFISSILIIILICLCIKRCKNKQIEPFLFGGRTMLATKFRNKLQTSQCPKCPDCNCPSIQISKTVSSDTQLQNLLDVYVKEGLDKIIENKKWDNIKIENNSEANKKLKNARDKMGLIVSNLTDYYTDTKNTLDQLLDFNDQNEAIIKSDVDESEIKIKLGSARFEIESFVSKIELLSLIIDKMGFYNKFLGNVVPQ
jgi:hypothetical protein